MAGVRVGDELRYDGALWDDLAVVVDGGYEAARVDLQVPLVAGAVQVDDDLFVFQAGLAEGDVGAVGPGTAVVGVEGDFGSGHFGMRCG